MTVLSVVALFVMPFFLLGSIWIVADVYKGEQLDYAKWKRDYNPGGRFNSSAPEKPRFRWEFIILALAVPALIFTIIALFGLLPIFIGAVLLFFFAAVIALAG